MNIITAKIAIAVILAVGLGGIYYFIAEDKKPDERNVMMKKDSSVMTQETSSQQIVMDSKEDGAMMEKDDVVMKEKRGVSFLGTVLAGTSAPLLDFNKSDYEKAVTSGKTILLYFYANWCPICRVEFPKMQSAFNKLTTDQIIAFRVNYKDDQTDAAEVDLAREFGVAYQHTKVFVRGGKIVSKYPDSWEEGRYILEINKILK